MLPADVLHLNIQTPNNFTMKKLLLLSILTAFCFYGFSQSSAHEDCMHSKIRSYKSMQSFSPSGLTDNYNLVYQRPFWEINPAQHYIKGHVSSYFKPLQNGFETLYFDLSDNMIVDSVLQRGTNLTFKHENDLIEITLPAPLAENTLDSVTVYYKGAPSSAGFGSFETSYHGNTPVMWTLSEPYGARDWWPCKQTLTDKIDSIDIFVQTDPAYKVGSNGILISETTAGEYKTTHWKHRHPITTYLVAIAVTNYAEFSDFAMVDETNSVEILNYVYPEDLNTFESAAEYTVDVMELFSDLFIPYPFWNEKYGHAQFGWGGGMEHQTMSFMGGFGQGLIAHELAHQWFGDFITCGSWQDIWVNEGFATFCENITVENLHPENWNNWKKGELNYVLGSGKSGSVYVDDTTSVSRIFSGVLSYAKGGYLLHMLRFQIGDEAFYSGLKNMLQDAAFANAYAKGSDVQSFLEEAADTSLTEFFNDWYYGQGYPKYEITWSQNAENELTFMVNQTQTHNSVDFFEMKLPFVLNADDQNETIELHHMYNGQSFTVNPGFEVTSIGFDPNLNILTVHDNVLNYSGLDQMELQQLIVTPNPVKDILYVQSANNAKIQQAIIVDAQGKLVMSINELQNNSITTASLQNGVYFIKAETENGTLTQKFIKTN